MTTRKDAGTEKKCRRAGCGRKAFSRGACWSHYVEYRASINAGDTTDAELVRKGWLEQRKTVGRKAKSAAKK